MRKNKIYLANMSDIIGVDFGEDSKTIIGIRTREHKVFRTLYRHPRRESRCTYAMFKLPRKLKKSLLNELAQDVDFKHCGYYYHVFSNKHNNNRKRLYAYYSYRKGKKKGHFSTDRFDYNWWKDIRFDPINSVFKDGLLHPKVALRIPEDWNNISLGRNADKFTAEIALKEFGYLQNLKIELPEHLRETIKLYQDYKIQNTVLYNTGYPECCSMFRSNEARGLSMDHLITGNDLSSEDDKQV